MVEAFSIPEEFTSTFKRLVHQLPESLRDDPETLNTLLMYLRLGGRNLGLHYVDLQKKTFEESVRLVKRRPRPIPAESEEAEVEEEEDDEELEGDDDSEEDLEEEEDEL